MAQFLVDEQGNTTGVLLDVDTYNALIAAAGAPGTIGADVAQKRAIRADRTPVPLTEAERAVTLAVLDRIDQTAAEIGADWPARLSAVEAVKEQRREL